VAAAIAAAAVFSSAAAANAEQGARYRPADGERALLVIPTTAPQASHPADADSAARRAEELLALARATGDARYFGRAESAIRPWLDRRPASPRIDLAAAELAQSRHDFAEARSRLDRFVATDPRDAGARVKRANVALLMGDHAAARRDCVAAMQSGSALPGTICLAAAMTGPGSTNRARRLLATLDTAGHAAPAMLRWRLLTGADLALRAGDAADALALLERAHALDGRDEEARTRLAETLLAAGEARRALAVTDAPNPSIARRLAQIRAGAALADPRTGTWRRELDAALAVARRRGETTHVREEARLVLHDGGDTQRALALARRNFAIQKDTPDLRLLADAAAAAGDRAALMAVRQWLQATGFEDRAVEARLREAGA
jgi:tetratricopeptide (TPR) repeat protein